MSSTETERKKAREAKVLVTGATSLLGRLVTAELLRRGSRVLALCRSSSTYNTIESFATSLYNIEDVPWEHLQMIRGDVLEPDLGLGPMINETLGEVTEIVHLARPRADEDPVPGALAMGLDGVIDVARRLGDVRRLMILSTTEVSGDFEGRFYEDWLDIGQRFPTVHAREVLEAESRARQGADYLPVCIVRQAILVGHTRTGQMECDAGFGRIFALGQVFSQLPSFLKPPGPANGQRFVTISPVDYVAAGIVELTFSEAVGERELFCLADPSPPTLAELFELILDRAGGPSPGLRIPIEGKGVVGKSVELFARLGTAATDALGMGGGLLAYLIQRGEHDVTNSLRVLEPAGIVCPPLATYFDALLEDYQRRHQRFQH